MTPLRKTIMAMSNKELFQVFKEMQVFEETCEVSENTILRTVAKTLLTDTPMNMLVVGHEVWREIAMRNCDEI